MVDQLNHVLNKLSRNNKCCHKCIYCGSGFFDSLKSYRCELKGNTIDEREVDSKSCLRFVGKKAGIPVQRQMYNTKINKIKRNWYYIVIATCTVIGLVITLLKTLGMI